MSKLDQMRRGMERLILIDRDIGLVTRAVKEDNGRGQQIATDKITKHMIMCRVSYQTGDVWPSTQWEGGVTIDKTPFILSRYDVDLEQGDVLEWRKRAYTVGVVTRPEIGGGFVCTQAPLVEISLVDKT